MELLKEHNSKQRKQAKLTWLKAMGMKKLSRRPKQMGNEKASETVTGFIFNE